MKPKVFGKRPILMQRWEGGIRIIHVDGRVEYSDHLTGREYPPFANADGCTSRPTQKEAYKACLEYDKTYSNMNPNDETRYGAFLGYL